MHPNGRSGEDLVVRTLIQKGFEIIKRNFYWCRHEIDIIAQKNEIIYLFEVKHMKDKSFLRIKPKQIEAYDNFINLYYQNQIVKVYFALVCNNQIEFITMELN